MPSLDDGIRNASPKLWILPPKCLSDFPIAKVRCSCGPVIMHCPCWVVEVLEGMAAVLMRFGPKTFAPLLQLSWFYGP